MTEVKKIIPSENKVIGEDGVFTYDKLVIATGCKTNFFGNEKMQDLALGMKNTQEAITIRNHILMTFEKMIIERKASDDGNWNLVIVGSGPTGVELAGAFSEMKSSILPRDYPRMNFSDLNIILISSSDKPLDAMSQESQDAAEKYLIQLGVNFMKNERVTDYDGEVIYMKSGNSIPTNNVIWAAGVTGNIIDDFNIENLVRNRYIVDRYNKVKGFDNIFAIGDIAYMETPKYPQGHYQYKIVGIFFQALYNSKRFTNNTESNFLKDYLILNAGININPIKNLQVGFKVNNITDQIYETVNYYFMPKRNYAVSLTLSY